MAQTVVTGRMDVQLATDVSVFSLSFSPHNFLPEEEFNSFYRQHFIKKGAEASRAVHMVTALK